MIVRRAIAAAIALAALVTATGCAVVALSFTVYALLRDTLTPAGASAAVVAICAFIALIAALVASRQAKFGSSRPAAATVRPASITDKVMDVAREHPLVAAGLAAAAGAAAFANPALVTAVLRAFTEKTRGRQ